jgi:hypothetical protein
VATDRAARLRQVRKGMPRLAIGCHHALNHRYPPTALRPCMTTPLDALATQLACRLLAGSRSDALAVVTPHLEAIAQATDVFPRFLAIGYRARPRANHGWRA